MELKIFTSAVLFSCWAGGLAGGFAGGFAGSLAEGLAESLSRDLAGESTRFDTARARLGNS